MQRLTPSIFSNRRCGFQNNPQANIAIPYFFLVGFKDKILGHILSLSSLLLLLMLSFFPCRRSPSAVSSLRLVFVGLVVVDAATWSLLLCFLLGLMGHIEIVFAKAFLRTVCKVLCLVVRCTLVWLEFSTLLFSMRSEQKDSKEV